MEGPDYNGGPPHGRGAHALRPARACRAGAPPVEPRTHAQLTTPNQYSLPVFVTYDFYGSVNETVSNIWCQDVFNILRIFSYLRHASGFNWEYINNVYRNVSVNETVAVSYTISSKLFSIVDNKIENNRKRTLKSASYHEETIKVKSIFERLLLQLPSTVAAFALKSKLLDTSAVRNLAQKLFESTVFNFEGLNGGNNSEVPIKCIIAENHFLIPPHSRYF
ncbi:unnamed protein product [Arctia plantaginis]|uniref:Uncharacterized protein n=1 Tax=Arctia plantaginis TaxID=874455 RepID=A0A8S0Z7U4_ARCPL|nr:unnamed protein product [Arctia plantaginis]